MTTTPWRWGRGRRRSGWLEAKFEEYANGHFSDTTVDSYWIAIMFYFETVYFDAPEFSSSVALQDSIDMADGLLSCGISPWYENKGKKGAVSPNAFNTRYLRSPV